MASGAGAAVSTTLTPKVVLYKRVLTGEQRAAANDEANALISAVASIRGVPSGSRCNFQLENSEDRVSFSVTGDELYVGEALRLGTLRGWKRSLVVTEEIIVRTYVPGEKTEEHMTVLARPNFKRPHNLARVTRRSEGFPVAGGVSHFASAYPQLTLANAARLTSEARQEVRYAGRRAVRRPFNAELLGRQHAQDPNVRQTRRNVRGRSSSSSSE